MNIPIVGGYSEDERATTSEDVGPSDKSLLRSFRFHKTRSMALGQAKTNSFYFKWGEMTLTLDDVKQFFGLHVDGDATDIGGTWGFPAILEVFENNLRQDLNAFKSLKAGGARNSLSLRKLKEHYTYKLEKIISDGTATTTKKKKGLTARSIARAYMLYVLGSFLLPMKKGTDISARYLYLFAKDKVEKKWSWGSAVLAHMYYNLGTLFRDNGRQFTCCTTLLKKLDLSVTDRYGGTTLLKFWEALDNYKLEDFNREQGIPAKRLLTKIFNLCNAKELRKFNLKYEWVDYFSGQKWKEFILKKADRGWRVREGLLVCTEGYLEWFASVSWTTICPITIDLATNDDLRIHQRKEVSVNEHGDTPVHQSEDVVKQYDASILKCKNLEEKNISLEAKLRRKSGLENCNQSLSAELNKKCKKSESLKAVNTLLMEQIDLYLSPAIPLVILQSHQLVPDATLAKKYDDLLVVHEDVKKKLISKRDFVSHSK
ncbi:hypothetical protein GIB67_006775 [Kingdonia uniflora]|uniref:Aminotransferase-like plant mobile domain-containing protein n=1 Tax=Kingdonia uniflora TaxID=39325 RepID=A0A7J7KZV7_9MAGN|nr:hypothetical protein GIB67_006775 [Kingdonia uniflora]